MNILKILYYLCLEEHIKLKLCIGFIIFYYGSVYCDSFDVNVEKLRSKMFLNNISKSSCLILLQNEDQNLEKIKIVKFHDMLIIKDLERLVGSVFKSLHYKNSSMLTDLFHPRLKVSEEIFKYIMFKDLPKVYGVQIKYKLLFLGGINAPEGRSEVVSCNDNIKVSPHYGYNLQFAVLIDIIGDKEDGKIYFSVVPYNGDWKIGVWKLKQWSFLKKDPQVWFKDGVKDLNNQHKLLAYLKFNIASKMAHGEGYYWFDIYEKIEQQQKLFKKEEYLLKLQSITALNDIFDFDGLYMAKGIGISLTIKLKNEENLKSLNNRCADITRQIINYQELNHIEGVKCVFIMQEQKKNHIKEIASFIISKDDIK